MKDKAHAPVSRVGPGGVRDRLLSWLVRHVQVFFYSLGQLSRTPFGSLMTAAVIGIALALPTGLYVLLENAQSVGRGWDGTAQISVFLKAEVDDRAAGRLAGELRRMPAVASAHLITRAQALAEYREMSGFGDVLRALDHNPLPAVIVLQPATGELEPERIHRLVRELGERPEVDLAQFDLQWVKRFYAIMEIVQRGILVVFALLSLAVLLIVGNTIRLGINNRRDEIEIAKLFGATDAFIRRPFLYTGLWYGLGGGVIAWLLVSTSFALLGGPVRQLADLYYSDFLLGGLDHRATLVLLAFSALLGLAGSWVAVGRHLDEIEPS